MARTRSASGATPANVGKDIQTGEIDDQAVTNPKLAYMSEGRIKGRVSTGGGAPEDLTAAQARTVTGTDASGTARPPLGHGSDHTDGTDDVPDLDGDSGSGGTHGLAPAPAAGDAAAGKFLKADATYARPPGIKAIFNENFNPTDGQTVFTLAWSIGGGQFSILFVNGIQYLTTADYAISGSTLSWLDTDFTLEEGDIVDVFYETG